MAMLRNSHEKLNNDLQKDICNGNMYVRMIL